MSPRICESSDGSLRVVELDPTKKYVLFVSENFRFDMSEISLEDGAINIINKGASIQFVQVDDVKSLAVAQGRHPS